MRVMAVSLVIGDLQPYPWQVGVALLGDSIISGSNKYHTLHLSFIGCSRQQQTSCGFLVEGIFWRDQTFSGVKSYDLIIS
jgi:hypothetical protein